MPNPTPQSIVEKLSEAQRWVIGGEVRHNYGDTLANHGGLGTIRALNRLGLLDGTMFTPLGLQVRAILSRKEQNDG